MKHLKKIGVVLVVGFFAFAPPGTLIFIGVLLLGLLGKTWFFLGLIAGLILMAVYGFVYRHKLAENYYLKSLLQKFRK